MIDDLISRQAAIDEIARFVGYIDEDMILRLQIALKRLQAIEPKKGKWKEVQVPFGRDFTTKEYECEICGYQQYHHENFCGRCGAKMEESDEYPD